MASLIYRKIKSKPTYDELSRFFDNLPNGSFSISDLNTIDDEDDRTPLIEAVHNHDYKAVSLLLSKGANPNTTNSKNKTALWYATKFSGSGGKREPLLKICRSLVYYKANIGIADTETRATPLMNTIYNQDISRAQILVDVGGYESSSDLDKLVAHLPGEWPSLFKGRKPWYRRGWGRIGRSIVNGIMAFFDEILRWATPFFKVVADGYGKKTSFALGNTNETKQPAPVLHHSSAKTTTSQPYSSAYDPPRPNHSGSSNASRRPKSTVVSDERPIISGTGRAIPEFEEKLVSKKANVGPGIARITGGNTISRASPIAVESRSRSSTIGISVEPESSVSPPPRAVNTGITSSNPQSEHPVQVDLAPYSSPTPTATSTEGTTQLFHKSSSSSLNSDTTTNLSTLSLSTAASSISLASDFQCTKVLPGIAHDGVSKTSQKTGTIPESCHSGLPLDIGDDSSQSVQGLIQPSPSDKYTAPAESATTNTFDTTIAQASNTRPQQVTKSAARARASPAPPVPHSVSSHEVKTKAVNPQVKVPVFHSAEDVRSQLSRTLDKSGLRAYFPRSEFGYPTFLEEVINRAVHLVEKENSIKRPSVLALRRNRNGATTASTSPPPPLSMTAITSELKPMQELIKLSLYKPILFLDNSSSMNEGNRKAVLHEMIERVLFIATRLVPDDSGVLVRFINEQKNVLEDVATSKSLDILHTELAKVEYDACTPLGTELYKQILKPHVYDAFKNKTFTRPLLIAIVTDGEPNLEAKDCFQKRIRQCKKFLQKNRFEYRRDVRILIIQIGDSPDASQFLSDIVKDYHLSDFVHVITERLDKIFEEYNRNEGELELWLLETLAAPLKTAKLLR